MIATRPVTKVVTIKFDAELIEAVRRAAIEDRRSFTGELEFLVEQSLRLRKTIENHTASGEA